MRTLALALVGVAMLAAPAAAKSGPSFPSAMLGDWCLIGDRAADGHYDAFVRDAECPTAATLIVRAGSFREFTDGAGDVRDCRITHKSPIRPTRFEAAFDFEAECSGQKITGKIGYRGDETLILDGRRPR